MNWKAAIMWIRASLSAMLIIMILFGILLGLVIKDSSGEINVLSGIMVPLLILMAFLPQILGILVVGPILWAIISKFYTSFETSDRFLFILGMYCFLCGLAFGPLISTEPLVWMFGNIIMAASLFLPRIYSKKLVAGTFA